MGDAIPGSDPSDPLTWRLEHPGASGLFDWVDSLAEQAADRRNPRCLF